MLLRLSAYIFQFLNWINVNLIKNMGYITVTICNKGKAA